MQLGKSTVVPPVYLGHINGLGSAILSPLDESKYNKIYRRAAQNPEDEQIKNKYRTILSAV